MPAKIQTKYVNTKILIVDKLFSKSDRQKFL